MKQLMSNRGLAKKRDSNDLWKSKNGSKEYTRFLF